MNEFSWKDVTNALSLANLILGLFSIFCSFCKRCHCASWMLLISFLLDTAVGAITRHLSLCSRSGVELNDFAVFTTFGLASALLLGVDGPLSGFLAVIYVLAATFRLCFYSTGAQLTHKGLPCRYASCVLASTSLLTKGNTFILSCMASLMILFMMDQSYYPHDEILESENWKKLVYLGGEWPWPLVVASYPCCSLPPAPRPRSPERPCPALPFSVWRGFTCSLSPHSRPAPGSRTLFYSHGTPWTQDCADHRPEAQECLLNVSTFNREPLPYARGWEPNR
ncbi:transmembrane protein 269 isoform X1 [Ursus arctos]|uniref:transmembrane protein 269 isoform X1 n=1 Tax=Ursus arctos TaxID=9644 RepID=UPI00254703F4|nr:transmembrane protein 269 isoform X1 [Ursus arctos]